MVVNLTLEQISRLVTVPNEGGKIEIEVEVEDGRIVFWRQCK